MVAEAMSKLESAVEEVQQKVREQKIDSCLATELIARFHRIETIVSRIELGSEARTAA